MAGTPLVLDPAALERDLQTLTKLNPRRIGSPAEAKARAHVEAALIDAGLDVRRHEFPYLGWSLDEPPAARFGVQGWAADAPLAFTYSPPTPEGGVSGMLEWVGQHWVAGLQRWDKFRIADDSGSTVGYVSGVPTGPAVPAPLAESSSPLPHFIIGEGDLARLRSELAEPGRLEFQGTIVSRLDRDATGVNLAATIPGTGKDAHSMALCSHLDSLDDSRAAGATRALAALLGLVRHYARNPAPRTIEALLFTGTEADIAGSKAYLADHPDLWDVSLAINVDEIPDDDPLLVASVPEALEAHLYGIVESIDPSAPREFRSPVPPGGDQLPFAAVGAPVLMLGRGRSAGRTASRSDPARAVSDVVRIVSEVLDDPELDVRAAASKRGRLDAHRDRPWEHTMSLKQY